MGKYLQIRVVAATYRPEDVKDAWPKLSRFLWPPQPSGDHSVKGVLELVRGLCDKLRYGEDVPGKLKSQILELSEKADAVRLKLEASLSSRDPKLADSLSYELEDMLDEMERKAQTVL